MESKVYDVKPADRLATVNEYYFSRVFKKVTDRTPGEYRKKHAKS